MKKDFIAITDWTAEEIRQGIKEAVELKKLTKAGKCPKPLADKSVGLIFHKPSLRTRISFEVGVAQLGGNAIYITDNEIQLGKRESVEDAALVLSRFLDIIEIRTFSHDDVEKLGHFASVPIINGLTDLLHPCQIMADTLTIYEHTGKMENFSICYLGDGNNIVNSWLKLATRLPIDLRMAVGVGCNPDEQILKEAQNAGISKILLTNNVEEAVTGAEVLYTDVWASMGQKDQADRKAEILKEYQINKRIVDMTGLDTKVMHCLPAERGKEITDEVMDGPHSIVFDQAENRLHMQKTIMMKAFEYANRK